MTPEECRNLMRAIIALDPLLKKITCTPCRGGTVEFQIDTVGINGSFTTSIKPRPFEATSRANAAAQFVEAIKNLTPASCPRDQHPADQKRLHLVIDRDIIEHEDGRISGRFGVGITPTVKSFGKLL